jgi:xylulokinase
MDDLLLGIDVGTGSLKCRLVDLDGNPVGSAGQEYRPLLPRPGLVEQDPADWYRAFLDSLGQIRATTGVSPARVRAVGVTGQMRGPTFIDGAGQPVRPSILWNDLRCQQEVNDLSTHFAHLLEPVTHNPINTMCTLPKLLWVLRHEPETWQKTATMIYPKDYINFRLTGKLSTDLSDASGSSFYDLKDQTWSYGILNVFAIDREKLPYLYASTEVIGLVNQQAHAETGLPEGTPVVAGGSDATVELLASGVENARQCKIRLGTSGALSTVVDHLDHEPGARYYCWSYVLPNRWMLDLNTRTCANATVWLKDVFFKDTPDSAAAYDRIGREAAEIPVGAEGLFFHPYLLGEDAPYWAPHLKGSFFGLSVYHRRAHCARAVLEGTGFALRDARSSYGPLADGFESYIFVGGGVKNKVWLSIVADILGVDGEVAEQTDAAYGAAMLAGIGAGVFDSVAAAVDICTRDRPRVRHNPDNHARYSALFEKYVRMKQVFDALYDGIVDT